ncbi:adenylate/guanylate cyclase domain-containing protein [Nitrosopumilus sp. b1]|uniref:cache domain-containing protein n=1 Tax=Nitrosopumilus sp. b1 TaxID=2109907 RepID=UPI0015F73E70|nr:cache domain-containing protein [Nitrosopumilus sp. b1]KAF6242509.1 adenylate/guanylate cyclase domain-containing protein [Nitrosopumilus sp. b1]
MVKKFISISSKLIVLVLSIAIVSIVITSTLSFTVAESIIKNDVESALRAEANNRGSTIGSIIDNRIELLQELARNPVLFDTFSALSFSVDEITFGKLLDERKLTLENEVMNFQRDQLNAGLRDFAIISSPGRVIYSLNNPEQIGTLAKSLDKVTQTTVKFIQDNNKERLMTITVPILSESSAQQGVITATMTSSVFDDILQSRFGLDETGEVYLVNKNEMMISESIFIDNAAFNQRVNTVPVKECFENGKSVDGLEYLDYRGVEIFGVSHCRSDLGFVLLTEVDESAILVPVYDLQSKIILVSGALIVAATIVTFFLSRKFSRPILKLKSAAELVAKGNFDVETKIETNDEIEELSKSFDSMTKTIKETVSAITKRENIIRRQEDLLSQFSKEKKESCVCLVDLVGSVKITQSLSEEQKRRYYEIFSDSVIEIVRKHKGVPVKFIDDAILFYFPVGSDNVFQQSIDCCLNLAESSSAINKKMESEGLPGIGYRISSTFGSIQIVGGGDKIVSDIFGESVNMCFKINPYALPNSLIIDSIMYEKAKTLDFSFTKLDESIVKELDYKVFIVHRK